ncbi:hypothetical protein BH10BDE1_BH10BDE1_13500 [soil metagenome]
MVSDTNLVAMVLGTVATALIALRMLADARQKPVRVNAKKPSPARQNSEF